MRGVASVGHGGNPTTGIVLFALGLAVLAGAVLGPVPDLAVWPMAGVGVFMAVLGVAIAVKEVMRPPPAPAPKPATQAFLEKQRHALPTPRRLEAPAPADAPPAEPAPAAPTSALEAVEAEIQQLSKEIGRAKVMYGTGKLSGEGYRAYVADLEKRRGDLEAQRARILMGKPE